MVLTTHGDDASGLADQKAAVAEYNAKFASATPTTPQSQSQTSSGGGAGGPAPATQPSARTGARPQFSGEDRPIDVHGLYMFPEACITPLAQLEGEKELLGFIWIIDMGCS